MKKLLCMLIIFIMGLNSVALADTNDDYFEIANNSERYASVTVKAENIIVNEDSIEFSNSNKKDSNIYIIDDKTIFIKEPEGVPDLEWFLDGRASYIFIHIRNEDYYGYSKKTNQKINVVAVGGFTSRMVGIGKESETQKEDFGFIYSFGIMQWGTIEGFDRQYITRAEAAQIIVNILRMKNSKSYSAKQDFLDVNMEHWAYNPVRLCRDYGIINGYSNGMYYPEELITYEQLIKFFVSVLGYSPLVNENGGYPDGYIKVAKDIGILNNVDIEYKDYATRINAARMILNLVYLPVMEQTVYGKKPEYQIMDGNNGMPLKRFFDKYFVSNTD